MAEERQELRHINWKEVFGFTQIFKSFRMAIHPSKLMLSFLAIALIFLTGLVMDGVWSIGGRYVGDDEIMAHATRSEAQFDRGKEAWERGRLEEAAKLLAEMQRQRLSLAGFVAKLPRGERDPVKNKTINAEFSTAFKSELDKYRKKNEDKDKDLKPESAGEILKEAREKDKSWSALLGEADDVLDEMLDRIDDVRDDVEEEAGKLVDDDKDLSDDEKDRAKDEIGKADQRADQAITEIKFRFAERVRKIRGSGIFTSLADYELSCIRNAVLAATQLNFCGGLDVYRQRLAGRAINIAAGPVQQANLGTGTSLTNRARVCGVAYWVLMALEGGRWFIGEHYIYAIIFLLIAMAVIALFGGAVNRIAALHFAREEKISMMQALRFSSSKFFSFFAAPLIPVAFILLMGGLMAAGGLLGSIPYVGEIVMAVLFVLAIIAGLLIAFLLIGLVGGVGLMYPTIAVEGSDSFDAISRSFSYVFARPWRALLYGAIAAVYGAITYLFVRLFAFVALRSTHFFVKWGVWGQGTRLNPEADKLDVLWTKPQFNQLFGGWSWHAMDGTELIAAVIIGIWVFIVAGMVAAYMLSYAASATTVIYFLLRRKVDATDLDDVYVEEVEEEPVEGEEPPAAEEEASAEEPAAKKAKKAKRAKKADKPDDAAPDEGAEEDESQ